MFLMEPFYNDYCCSVHPDILKALSELGSRNFSGYGTDSLSAETRALLLDQCGLKNHGTVCFMAGGTQTNAVLLAYLLKPWQGVICAESAHIQYHEAGAIEVSGHRVIDLPGKNGKISPLEIENFCRRYEKDPTHAHMVQPGAVYISLPTETGMLYSLQELRDICTICRRFHLYFYIDGARLGYGMASPECDWTLKDLGALADAFYIGGTKQGALFGEAAVLTDRIDTDGLFPFMKQKGAVMAKGWLTALSFSVLFKNGLYMDLSKKAVGQALRIRRALEEKGVLPLYPSSTNQQFFNIPNEYLTCLSPHFAFDIGAPSDSSHTQIRICTAWSTEESSTGSLISAVKNL